MIGEDPFLANYVSTPPLTEEETRKETKPAEEEDDNCWQKPKSHLQQMEGGYEVERFLS